MDLEKAKAASAVAKEAFAKKDYALAIKSYTEAISFDPKDHILFSNRSACYASLKEYQDALDDANKCLELQPGFVRGYGRKGLAEFFLKKYDAAIETYTKGLQLDPNNEQLKEGLEQAKAAVQDDSLFGGQQEIMAKLMADPVTKEYFNDPDFVKKMELAQANPTLMVQLMQSDPRFMKIFNVMTGISMDDLVKGAKEGKEGKEEPGTVHMDDIPKPSHPAASSPPMTEEQQAKAKGEEEKAKGNTAYKDKKMEVAIEHYNEAIKAYGNEPLYYLNKALAYLEMKKFEDCLKACDEALEVAQKIIPRPFEKIAKGYSRKALCYTQMGNYAEAMASYDKALLEVNDPATREAKRNCEMLHKKQEEEKYIDPAKGEEHKEKGNAFYKDGNYASALAEYNEGIKRSPKNPTLFLNRALAYMKLTENEKALLDVEKCLALDPKCVKAYAKRGNIHFLLKEYHKAIDDFKKGLALEPTNEECLEGSEKTTQAIYQTPHDEERAKRSLDDPEIRAILMDPRIQQVLKEAREAPSSIQASMKDPFIAQAIQKLIAAGILGTK